jgi:hypothetical protein
MLDSRAGGVNPPALFFKVNPQLEAESPQNMVYLER